MPGSYATSVGLDKAKDSEGSPNNSSTQTGVRDKMNSSLGVNETVSPCGWRRQPDLV